MLGRMYSRRYLLLRTAAALFVLAAVSTACNLSTSRTPATPATPAEDCPLPDGATHPPPLPVTAQQVEAGTASLKDFVLSARSVLIEPNLTLEQASHYGCLVRKEGSDYRSGSTFLLFLTHDGRVWIHAKDMSLSGRPLNPAISQAILQAVGIEPADLADPATVYAAALAGNNGAFDLSASFPGAHGYASLYVSRIFGLPNLFIGGFDLDASHLVDEVLDYGDPAVTAADVVDRATLKAFVTEAGPYFAAPIARGDLSALSKARVALRDPDGPWRSGNTYLYVLDLTNELILVHGGFPDRYELRPLVPIARDVRTGEYILPQIIAAAKSSPEGGFVSYYFDDPEDDSDRADIPKTGYARVFTTEVPRPDGTFGMYEFIVGSGFYGNPN